MYSKIFRARCNSSPVVKPTSHFWLIRCNSEADGIVRMREDITTFVAFSAHSFTVGNFVFGGIFLKTKTDIKKISITAVLCALAYLCMFVFKFKVSFLTFDFKDAILAVVSFLYGPLYGVLSALIVALTEFVSVSDTGVYGLLMNFISSASFAGTCGLIYKYRRKISGAVMGCVFAVLVMTAVMLIANVLITPFYMGAPRETVIKMIPSLLLPFNLLKGVMNAAITIIIYKPITSALKRTKLVVYSGQNTDRKKFLLLTVLSVIIIIIAVIIIIFLLNGSFSVFHKINS